MEVIGAVASVSQLVAYSKSTLIVLRDLYKDLRRDPSEWRKQETEIALLLHIVENFSAQHFCSGQDSLPGAVLSLLLDLSTIAQTARALVASSQSTGPLGIRWAAFNVARELPQVLESLKPKREILQLFISQQSLEVSTTIRDNMSSEEAKHNLDMNADIVGKNNRSNSNNGWGRYAEKVTDLSVKASAKIDGEGNTSNSNNYEGGPSSEHNDPELQNNAQKAEESTTGNNFSGKGNTIGP